MFLLALSGEAGEDSCCARLPLVARALWTFKRLIGGECPVFGGWLAYDLRLYCWGERNLGE